MGSEDGASAFETALVQKEDMSQLLDSNPDFEAVHQYFVNREMNL